MDESDSATRRFGAHDIPRGADAISERLPSRNVFFDTFRLTDERKKVEQIFLEVDSIRGNRIYGRIASQIELVQGYRYGQQLDRPESELLDWMTAKPDGSEEDNVVGKFIDTSVPPTVCSFT